MTGKFTVKTPEQMEELGVKIARDLKGGDIILLSGELGAGKTVLCKGIAKGLGVTSQVVSPTFTLMNEHFGTDIEFCHFDAYRLSGADEAYGAGLCDFIGAQTCVCAVEWWINIAELFDGYDTVKIEINKIGDGARTVAISQN